MKPPTQLIVRGSQWVIWYSLAMPPMWGVYENGHFSLADSPAQLRICGTVFPLHATIFQATPANQLSCNELGCPLKNQQTFRLNTLT